MNKTILKEKVKSARTSRNWSQEMLSEQSKVSLRTIQRIEKGEVVPRAATLNILIEVLSLDEAKLKNLGEGNSDMALSSKQLKTMNLLVLLVCFFPGLNVILPLLYWKMTKNIEPLFKEEAGKIVSAQLLWTLLLGVAFILSIFFNNLLSDNAGQGLYVAMAVFVIGVIANILFVIRHAVLLKENKIIPLKKVPNLF